MKKINILGDEFYYRITSAWETEEVYTKFYRAIEISYKKFFFKKIKTKIKTMYAFGNGGGSTVPFDIEDPQYTKEYVKEYVENACLIFKQERQRKRDLKRGKVI